MYRSITLLVSILITLAGFCQSEIIGSIDGKPILKEEFERLYRKNNQSLMENSDKKTPIEYVELYINYKLKVHEAEQLGMDTIDSFVRELKTYRQEIAKPYLTDVQFSEKMVSDAYDRMTNEVKASHILFNLNENAPAKDTLRVFNKIIKIREQALAGENFEELAQQFSEDPSARSNKGVLGYFSAFQMVFPFENIAFKTPVGEISMPVRSRFGYHLIHVLDKRAAKGQIKVAHIMKRMQKNASEETVNQTKQLIDSLAILIESGDDFFKLARKFSDDRRSASQGGVISWFTSSGMVPEFSDASFALKNDDDVSPVIRTPYGFHIIKRMERKPVAPFDEMEQFIIDKIRKNPEISKHSKQLFINKLKSEYNFTINENSVLNLESASISEIKNPEDILFSFAGQQITQQDFALYLKNNVKSKSSIDLQFQNFIADQLTTYEDKNLENKHPDFKYLMKEYHDGILLFNISEEKIWSAASIDSTGLEHFYNKSKRKHQWEERFSGWVVKCPDQKTKDMVDEILSSDSELSKEELEDQIKQHSEKVVQIEKGFFEKGDNELIDYLVWNGLQPENYKDGLHFIRGNKIEPQPKTLNEAKGLYISDYQNFLEKEWIKQLRKKYKVKIKKKTIKSIEAV